MSFFSEPLCTSYGAYTPYIICIFILQHGVRLKSRRVSHSDWSAVGGRLVVWRDEDLEAADSGIFHDKSKRKKKFICEFIIL